MQDEDEKDFDEINNGRFILDMGAGWHELEYRASYFEIFGMLRAFATVGIKHLILISPHLEGRDPKMFSLW